MPKACEKEMEMPAVLKTNPFLPDLSADAMTAVMGDAWQQASGMQLPAAALAQLQREYLQDATALWNLSLDHVGGENHSHPAAILDRRFAAKEWATHPDAAFTAQMYLLNSRMLMRMVEAVEGDAKTKAKLRFAAQQWIDAIAPSNFLALNPEAQQVALNSEGKSLLAGMQQLLHDAGKGRVSQTDESAFEVGRNVATTEGAVVFENELFQLIEYKPLAAKVHERPMLFVPPCINKFYIMDLQPDNSLIRYTAEQGHRLFVVSWRNPDASLAGKTWDDYIADAAIRAVDVVQELTGAKTLNTLGFCVGGTILATALAVLAARGRQPAHSVTLLTSLLDFSDTGVLDLFIDEAGVRLREMTLGDKSPNGPALLKGQELATTFSFLRPNDLVWNYVVANYLKGEAPPAFDLLYWNGDATNLPGPMYCWYLRHTYLQDELKLPGALTVCGEKVDLGAIKAPVFIYASREDHIVPWKSAYASTRIMSGKKRFVLGASGHIAGVINPPSKNKRNYWTNELLPASADDWFDGATAVPGSWWGCWAAWLKPLSGALVAAPKAVGSRKYAPIEPAFGRYVRQKA
jgi:polyhydroxyalkanoate synthase